MRALIVLLLWIATSSLKAAETDTKIEERVGAILHKADFERYAAIAKVEREYRRAVAKTFQFADRVEVFLLDHSVGVDPAYKPKEDDETFPIRPYDKETKVLKKSAVAAPEIPKWINAVTKTITSEETGGGSLCHLPIHGLRIYAGDLLLFETSICWICGNYYFQKQWESLGPDAEDLSVLLDEMMPVPKEEKDRLPGKK